MQSKPISIHDILKIASQGNLSLIDSHLKANPSLAKEKGSFINETWRLQSVTLLELAAMQLDIEMVELVKTFLSPEESIQQLRHISAEHFYSAALLLEAVQAYIDQYPDLSSDQRTKFWAEKVGRLQKLAPAWLIFSWCEQGEDADWITGQFKKSATRDFSPNEWNETALDFWFHAKRNNGEGVGSTWGFHRGTVPLFYLNSPWRSFHPTIESAEHDKTCLTSLCRMRQQQLNTLCRPPQVQENATNINTNANAIPETTTTHEPSIIDKPVYTTETSTLTLFQHQPLGTGKRIPENAKGATTSSCCVIC